MADFKLFEPLLLHNEGFYCNKKNDKGGETWEGIARNYFPQWSGWHIIDSYRSKLPSNDLAGWHVFSAFLKALPDLQELVDIFYKHEFWDMMKGDSIENQSIANFIGDWGVNSGISIPVKHSQTIVGVPVDGKIGPQTVEAINAAVSQDGQTFFNSLKQARINFYHAVVAAHPDHAEFLSDWLERTNSFSYNT